MILHRFELEKCMESYSSMFQVKKNFGSLNNGRYSQGYLTLMSAKKKFANQYYNCLELKKKEFFFVV